LQGKHIAKVVISHITASRVSQLFANCAHHFAASVQIANSTLIIYSRLGEMVK